MPLAKWCRKPVPPRVLSRTSNALSSQFSMSRRLLTTGRLDCAGAAVGSAGGPWLLELPSVGGAGGPLSLELPASGA
eukprot:6220112-Alexandrium_andersonii.AAC.1